MIDFLKKSLFFISRRKMKIWNQFVINKTKYYSTFHIFP